MSILLLNYLNEGGRKIDKENKCSAWQENPYSQRSAAAGSREIRLE